MEPRFPLDTPTLRRSFDKAARGFDAAAVLQREVRQRMLARLDALRNEPQTILDLGAGTAHAARSLNARFPHARILALDSAHGMLSESRRQLGALRKLLGRGPQLICADAGTLPLRDATIDWIFSNLMLPWCASPDAVFAEARRVLKPGGMLSFSSFGPDTLRELRRAWRQVDSHEHVHGFIEMHDLGDALVRAGFAEPVLDVERFTLTYGDVAALLRDLKATGSRNAIPQRARGLRGRSMLTLLATAYESQRQNGVLPATYEVVYGQAWQLEQASGRHREAEHRVPIAALKGRRRSPNN